MTMPQVPQAVPAPPPPYQVTPQPGDWLDELLCQLDAAKAAAKEAADLRDALDARVKTALTANLPEGTRKVQIAAGPYREARTLTWRTPRRLNRGRLDRDYPGLYEAYLEYGKPGWSW